MSDRFDIPVLDDQADYRTWKKKVAIWKLGTSAKKSQQASKLIMNMRGKPQEVSINIPVETLGAEDGVDKLLAELDKLYEKDKTQSLFKAIDNFERYRRKDGDDIDSYILEFQRRYKTLTQLQNNKELYDDVILAYRLLNQASLDGEQTRLVRATCTSGLTYDNMQGQLKRTFGDSVMAVSKSTALPFKTSDGPEIKQEPIFYTSRGEDKDPGHYENDHNEGEGRVYWSGDHNKTWNQERRHQQHAPYSNRNYHPNRGYHHNNNRYNPYAPKYGQRSHPQRGSKRPYQQRGNEESKNSPNNSPNSSPKGSPKRSCFLCHEPGHMCTECPYNTFPKMQQTTQSQDAKHDRKVYAIFDDELPLPDSVHALLDTGSCKTVCGNKWLIRYLESLTQEERECIYFERYDQNVCFGDRDPVTSKLRTVLPVTICGVRTVIRVYIVARDVPLLLAIDNMKRLKIVIDFTNNRISIGSRHQDLIQTESGHSLVSLSENTEPLEETTPTTLEEEFESGPSGSNKETVTEKTVSGDSTKKKKKKKRKKKKKTTMADKTENEHANQPDSCSSTENQAQVSTETRTTNPISHQMDRGVT